jgi:very-short-patch-repair endonuclease
METAPDSPEAVRERAVSLAEYLLAVRALLEKPARTVPTADAFWQADLPTHPAVTVGPGDTTGPWLRVGRPTPPANPVIPAPFVPDLVWDLSYVDTPRLPDRGSGSQGEAARAGISTGKGSPEFDAWLANVWRPWADEAAAAEATRRLHDRLYDLRYRLDVDVSRVELVWGHAILSAKLGGERVTYPLVATPVAIEYDPETTTVSVVPQGPPRLQPDALSDVDNRRVADLLELGGPAGQVEVDPWDAQERREFAGRALRRLGFDPVLRDPGAPGASAPHVVDTGVLFVRPRQRMVRRFLADMHERLGATESGDGVRSDGARSDGARSDGARSDGARSVGALANILAHEPSRLVLPDDDPEGWAQAGARLLMPMPTNEAQESIARRLAVHRNVAVQGPPGTGKTHTIRNLICHLMAHGKRVLVLAQKEDPLRVLRDGLPEEIQPLCLAILGRSADQLVQLQIAARELSDRAATLDQAHEGRWVTRLTEEIERAEAELAEAQDRLREAAVREAATFEIDGGTVTASEVGAWLRRNAPALNLIPDPIPVDTPAPLEPAEFAVLADIAREVSAEDRAAALSPLPVDGQLPTGEQLAARRTGLSDALKVVDALQDRGISVDGVRQLTEPQLDQLARTLRTEADQLTRREGSWTDRLGHLVRDASWRSVWDAHVAACQQTLTELGRRTAFLSGRTVEVPDEHLAEPRRLLGQLGEIRGRLAEGRRVGRLTQGDLYRLMEQLHVDGEPVRTLADVELVIASVERQQLRVQLAARWAEWAARLGFPLPPGDEPEVWAGPLLTTALDALDWERRRWPALYHQVVALYPRCERNIDARTLAELAGAVEACGNVLTADRLAAERDALSGWIDQVASSSPTLGELAAAWHAGDMTDGRSGSPGVAPGAGTSTWDDALAEIRRLWTVRPQAMRFAELAARLRLVAPQWTVEIEDAEALPDNGETALRGWRWRQAQTWFDETVGAVDTAGLGRRVEHCRDRIQQLTRDLVVTSAWLSVARTLDDRKKAALADWTAALRKIGKGTGKSAAHWQAVAQRAMAEAVTAVPVWVMSIDRALEQFRGAEQLFDVVIVDEASQADIFALPVLSLARRAVVVGDDQQIGPQIVGVPTDRVQALIGAHLADVPSAEHFDTDSSLYDHAVRRSPERILLTEHFRCVPAIISFSSEHYYDRKIQPLRADLPTGIGAPVQAVFVPGGLREQRPDFGEVNVPEAEALVSRVALIVADPAYDGKTLGVVSLLSTSGQAAYLHHRLREEIGPDELERRALRVGDPYTFQGDERDVVLISMVVAGAGIGAFSKRDFHRRVNVAASRARDQLWLFHSVQLGELTADDARALLLAYCQRPRGGDTVPAEPEAACTNDFERAVLRRLHERGLRPIPQFRIGAFRIDFVLPAADGRRLAIECDGDRYHGADAFTADLRRQAILERVGNATFVRLRSSVFHRDPDVALAPVWERAEELGILPRSSPERPQR